MKINIISIVGILVVFLLIYNYIQISQVYINELMFHSDKLSRDLRITQITDYHGNNKVNSKKLLKKIKKFDPHIIVLTRDMMDVVTKDFQPTLKLIKDLTYINEKIFFVSGNHEIGNTKGNELILSLKEIGVLVLENENDRININGENINILGLSFYGSKSDYKNVIEGVNREDYTILLSHSPNRPIPCMAGIEDLILSGHYSWGTGKITCYRSSYSTRSRIYSKVCEGNI